MEIQQIISVIVFYVKLFCSLRFMFNSIFFLLCFCKQKLSNYLFIIGLRATVTLFQSFREKFFGHMFYDLFDVF